MYDAGKALRSVLFVGRSVVISQARNASMVTGKRTLFHILTILSLALLFLPECSTGRCLSSTVQKFREVVLPGEGSGNSSYSLFVDGHALGVYRCDGRYGTASYAHLIIYYRGLSVKVVNRHLTGPWGLSYLGAVSNVVQNGISISFHINGTAKLIVSKGVGERLFVIADHGLRYHDARSGTYTLSVHRFGIVSTDTLIQTTRIQGAIDAIALKRHGGTLEFPAGVYRTGTLFMRSNVRLYLAPGAIIQGSADPSEYPFDPGRIDTTGRTQDISSRLILFDGVRNASIEGLGEIDGMGQILNKVYHRVPNIIRIRNCKDIRIDGVILKRGAGWSLHIFKSDSVWVNNVKVFSGWSDGIDVDNSQNVFLSGILSSSYDDAFAIKSTWFDGYSQVVRNITLKNAILQSVKSAVKIGTETIASTMNHISVSNIVVASAREAITIKCYDGADINNVAYKNIHVDSCDDVFFWEIRRRHRAGEISRISIANIDVKGTHPSVFRGYNIRHQISGVTIAGFLMNGYRILNPQIAEFRQNRFVESVSFLAGSKG